MSKIVGAYETRRRHLHTENVAVAAGGYNEAEAPNESDYLRVRCFRCVCVFGDGMMECRNRNGVEVFCVVGVGVIVGFEIFVVLMSRSSWRMMETRC